MRSREYNNRAATVTKVLSRQIEVVMLEGVKKGTSRKFNRDNVKLKKKPEVASGSGGGSGNGAASIGGCGGSTLSSKLDSLFGKHSA